MGRGLKETSSRVPQVVTTAEAKNALKKWIEESALKVQQGQVTAALIHWFISQPPYVQAAVLSRIDRGMEHAYAAALKKLAAELEAKAKGFDLELVVLPPDPKPRKSPGQTSRPSSPSAKELSRNEG